MDTEQLNKELISDPSLWRLSIEIRDDRLEVVIFSILEDNSLIHRSIKLDTTKPIIAAIEEAVYDNPLLLSEFRKTDIVLATNRFTIVPSEIKDEDIYQEIMLSLWPDGDDSVVANPLTPSQETLLMSIDKPALAFMRRTFPMSRILHRLTPIITYFYNKDRLNNSTRMYVHLNDKSTDIIYLHNNQIYTANTYETPTMADVLYYIMSIAEANGFDLAHDEIMLCGDKDMRKRLDTELRKYANYVMPVVFPSSMFNAGKDVFEAPYELILIPLCG